MVVGIDGPDCASKTTLAGRLGDALENRAVRASADRFSHPRAQRYRRGGLSPVGYYHDSFDYPALRGEHLLPFLAGQSWLRTSGTGYEGDPGTNLTHNVPTRAVLVADGVFLLRPELRGLWTISVYLRVSAQESLRRAHRRAACSAVTCGGTCQARSSTGAVAIPRGKLTCWSTTNGPTWPGLSAGSSQAVKASDHRCG